MFPSIHPTEAVKILSAIAALIHVQFYFESCSSGSCCFHFNSLYFSGNAAVVLHYRVCVCVCVISSAYLQPASSWLTPVRATQGDRHIDALPLCVCVLKAIDRVCVKEGLR